MDTIMGILHIINKSKTINTLESFHIDNETKTDNKINDKCTVRHYRNFYMLIPKYTNRGQSPVKLPLHIANLLGHKLQHNKHARVRLASHLHKIFLLFVHSHTHYIFTVIRHLTTLSTGHIWTMFTWKKRCKCVPNSSIFQYIYIQIYRFEYWKSKLCTWYARILNWNTNVIRWFDHLQMWHNTFPTGSNY